MESTIVIAQGLTRVWLHGWQDICTVSRCVGHALGYAKKLHLYRVIGLALAPNPNP